MLNSLIGIIASSGGAAAAANSFESIATINVGAGGASGIDFNSIPSTYQHLQIRYLIKSGSTNNDFSMGVNGSFSISNSSKHEVKGNGSSASANAATSINFINWQDTTVTSLQSGQIAVGVIDILDYKDTNKTKTIRHLMGSDQNGAGYVILASGNLNTTSAISAVNFFNGYNWVQYSQFALYGIKG
jgi:hypothetical protein